VVSEETEKNKFSTYGFKKTPLGVVLPGWLELHWGVKAEKSKGIDLFKYIGI